jgi:hypothetical protein
MPSHCSPLDESLVFSEIRHIVAGAKSSGTALSPLTCAAEIVQLHPNCGLSLSAIEAAVSKAATDAGVRVETNLNVTGRDRYIITQALAYAIAVIDRLPPDWQESSDLADMKRLLEHLVPNGAKRQIAIENAIGHIEGID